MEHDSSTPASRRVEAYLDVILAPLARRLSPFHREELRRELRAHLWARVEAYRELGQPEDEAVTEALCQFGGAEDFTRQWLREWTKTPSRITLHEVWEAARPTLRLSLVPLLLAPATVALAGFLAFQSQIGGPFLGALFNVYLIVRCSTCTSSAWCSFPRSPSGWHRDIRLRVVPARECLPHCQWRSSASAH